MSYSRGAPENISCRNQIKCLYLNCQSAAKLGALDSLKMYCLYNSVDLLLLSETWFHDSIRDAELKFDNQLQVFRCDRTSRGGGVCVIARKIFKIVRIDLDSPGEFVAIDIIANSTYLRILCCYVSSSGSSSVRFD